MARVTGKNTKPEILVRKMVHAMGYRFRIHRKDLPGRPDVVIPRLRKVILVHGCFWHGHKGCHRASRPTTNVDFWNRKIDANIQRDRRDKRRLGREGWKALIIWECQTRYPVPLEKKLRRFLEKDVEPSL
ncbi:MAG TPA: very short patch repair endonuclease [Fibrobacteria bacterium]|nr:very short patch repair endonuclease [Fibrobacteria bacterium]